MNDQTYNVLTIEGDPTTWVLQTPISDSKLQQPGAPLVATITSPRAGTLLVSCRAIASVHLSSTPPALSPPSVGGPLWTDEQPAGPLWTDDKPGTSWLYLPTATGVTGSSAGYALPDGTNVTELSNTIMTAMTSSAFASVPVSTGALVLNGATLPFAAILNAATSG